MATTPINGTRYPVSSDSANLAQYFQNLALDVDDNLNPRYASSAARDAAITSPVDGMICSVNGVPYRRIGGNWRINRPRVIQRYAVIGGGSGSIISGGSAETGVTSGLTMNGGNSFTLYEASTFAIAASFRAGPNPANTSAAAQCTVKIDGAGQGNVAISRLDSTVSVTGTVALAAGSHTVALRVDAVGGAVSWVDGIVTLTEGTAE